MFLGTSLALGTACAALNGETSAATLLRSATADTKAVGGIVNKFTVILLTPIKEILCNLRVTLRADCEGAPINDAIAEVKAEQIGIHRHVLLWPVDSR